MNRPLSIVYFERCYLGALVLSFLTLAFTWSSQVDMLQRNPASAQLGDKFIYGSLLGGLVLGAVISLLLWYFAARRASVVAKWIIVVFFGFGVLSLISSLARGLMPAGLGGVFAIVNIVLQGVAVWMLFKPASKAWFAERGRVADVAEPFQ